MKRYVWHSNHPKYEVSAIQTNTRNCYGIHLLVVGIGELDTLGNLLLQSGHSLLDVGLLHRGQVLGNGDGSLHTILAELDLAGEELAAQDVLLNVSRLDHTGLAVQTSDHRGSEHSASVSHRQSGRTSTLLSGDDLITTELDSLGDGGHVQLGDQVVGQLAQQGNDGGSGMATNHGDVALSGLHVQGLGDELAGTDGVELGHTHDLARIMDAHLLEGLGEDRDGGVHGVANHEDASLGTSSGAGLSEVHGDTSVGVEQIVSGHTGLSGHTGGDDDHIRAVKDLQQVVLTVVALDLDLSVDVGEIHGDTGGTDDIVQGKARNVGVGGHQQRHGLTNTTGSTQNGNLSTLRMTPNPHSIQKT